MGQQAWLGLGLGLVWALCWLSLEVGGALGGSAGQAIGRDELVARVQQRYDRTTHLRARFQQETHMAGFDQVQTGEGQVYIRKPGMMRWDYSKPERQVIIANGETLWI